MAKLEIIQTYIDELRDNLTARRGESLKEYPLAQRCTWQAPQQGQLKWRRLKAR